MRIKFLISTLSLVMLFVSLSSFNTHRAKSKIVLSTQEVNTLDASFIGYSATGYNFTTYVNGKLQDLVFQEVTNEVLSKFDLKSNELVNASFEVTYQIQTKKTGNTGSYANAEKIKVITKLVNNY